MYKILYAKHSFVFFQQKQQQVQQQRQQRRQQQHRPGKGLPDTQDTTPLKLFREMISKRSKLG